MKKAIIIGLMLSAIPTTLLAANITFVIEALKNNEGSIQVGIYDTAKTFPKPEDRVKGCSGQGAFGPPDFEDAVFWVERDDLEMVVRMQY